MIEAETRFARPTDTGSNLSVALSKHRSTFLSFFVAQWFEFLDNEVSKRFPGGLTMRKEPARRDRVRVYLALPLKDVELLRAIEQRFVAKFPKLPAPKTGLPFELVIFVVDRFDLVLTRPPTQPCAACI